MELAFGRESLPVGLRSSDLFNGDAVITGSAGLVGSEAVHFFAQQGFQIVGIDNDMRSFYFGNSASTSWNRKLRQEKYGKQYRHFDVDIRDRDAIEAIFQEYGSDIKLVIHAAGWEISPGRSPGPIRG